MPEPVADASCLIVLDNAGWLSLLEALYGTVMVSEEVAQEFGRPLPPWIHVVPVRDRQHLRKLGRQMDAGEASTLALVLEQPDRLAILDDSAARRAARTLGLRFTGTLGVLVKAKGKGLIPAVHPLLVQLRDEGFWVTESVVQEVLRLAGEA